MTDSYVTVAGNLTADPTIGNTKGGDVFANFRVAVNHGYFDREKGVWLETGASFYKVSTFRALAVNVFESLHKGTPVVVHGKLRVNEWENGEKQGTEVQITAVAVGPNLSFGQADFTAVRRPHFTGNDPSADENVQAAFAQEHDGELPAGQEPPAGDDYDQEPVPEEPVAIGA
ncbi:single-stranded DNA-binding protein [Ornithinimicrobium sp. F0845]|uniref:single-stranded DNA-binding protein n=1 Tax=Ornithinimicrobium sp. F0845 TaxID=2926412 RepID=UPI001FF6DAB5|nr:single-stranded DNA-binding protein [Ornithinimicrobium sp. F0845]MCK0111624.1 single-stranded DNA-binding protein [Ornithinimicrobium sp. F0845]